MIHRTRLAREHGCRYVTVQTKPHVATGRNALRLGFQVAYTNAIVVQPARGWPLRHNLLIHKKMFAQLPDYKRGRSCSN